MSAEGFDKQDGSRTTKENAYNSFQLKKFRNVCRAPIIDHKTKTVLDYGAGGSDWDAPNFDPITGNSAKKFFNVDKVYTFEPARNQLGKKRADCVVCIDVLEHIYIADVPKVVEELFSLSKKLLVVNVACYKAAALLPNGENAHITVRSPDWWKGVFDTISIKYTNIEVLLICSTSFLSGVIFEKYKSNDWESSTSFTNELKFYHFKPN